MRDFSSIITNSLVDDKVAESQYSALTDQELVTIAQEGHEPATEYLLYKYRALVRTKVRSYFLLGAEKEDLLQIGMIGLWQAIIDYRHDKEISFLSFARICIERHIITAIKTATRQKQAPLNLSVPLDYPDDDSYSEWNLTEILVSESSVDPEELVLKREDSRRLHDVLRRLLSEFEWNVLCGYQIGKSYKEISCDLECNTKSVDNALTRIKRKISESSYFWPEILEPV